MDNLFVLKGQMQELYARYTLYIEKCVQFLLALATFYPINNNIGFMKGLSSPIATLGLSVISVFLPVIFTVLIGAGLILVHMYTVSLGITLVTVIIFLVIFIFYLKFSPKTAFILLLTPVAFMLKIPYVIPVAFGLVGSPACLVPVVCGTIVYYIITYVKVSAATLKGADAAGMIDQISVFIKQVFQNKEMWIAVLTFVICLFVVYSIRRKSVDHAWKIGIIAGAAVNIIITALGDIALNIHVAYVTLIIANVVGIIVGLALELIYFSVDYSRGEKIQYEDDEYYYYVKAIPKIVVAAPEKTVKRINKRHETEIIDTEQVRRKTAPRRQEGKRRPPNTKSSRLSGDMDQMLLTQSLRTELRLDEES